MNNSIQQWILLILSLSMTDWAAMLERVLPLLTLINLVLLFLVLPLAVFFRLFSAKILLRRYHAKEIRDKKSDIYETVYRLATKLGSPVPKVFITDSAMPNAFTVGRSAKHAAIVMTTALIELLDREEQEAVLAHELMHVKSTPPGTAAAALAGLFTAIVPFAFWGSIFTGFGQEDDPAPNLIKFFATSLVAPVAATIILLTYSPSREYEADVQSVLLHGKPDKLVSALRKIEAILNLHSFAVNPAHVHLYIMNPLHNGEVTIMDIRLPTYLFLFRTHPATDDRIAHLKQQSTEHKPAIKGVGLKKPLFFSFLSYLFVLFVIIVIDTFSNKDFVFARAAAISVLYLGAVSFLFAVIFAVFRAKTRTAKLFDIHHK